jgi:hypothetical protein
VNCDAAQKISDWNSELQKKSQRRMGLVSGCKPAGRCYLPAMKTPTYDDISRRAYFLWEERGCPSDQQSSIDCWLQAEDELWKNARRGDFDDEAHHDDYGSDERDSAESSPRDRNVEITNMDRALPADERRRARNARHPGSGSSSSRFESQQRENFIVVLNRGHLRIYAADKSTPELVESSDMPEGLQGYTDNDTDQAGRFPGTQGKGRGIGGSIDERLPMQEEQQRRIVREAVKRVEEFLAAHPDARWSFAAGPALQQPVLDELADDARSRLDKTIAKDLVNVRLTELPKYFSER